MKLVKLHSKDKHGFICSNGSVIGLNPRTLDLDLAEYADIAKHIGKSLIATEAIKSDVSNVETKKVLEIAKEIVAISEPVVIPEATELKFEEASKPQEAIQFEEAPAMTFEAPAQADNKKKKK